MTESISAVKSVQADERVFDQVRVPNRLAVIWSSVIGKKIVMAVTGWVFLLFLFAHVLGNLKVFSGPAAINTYSRFLREVGMPELNYGDLLWIVRTVLLVCVTLHILAALQLKILNLT